MVFFPLKYSCTWAYSVNTFVLMMPQAQTYVFSMSLCVLLSSNRLLKTIWRWRIFSLVFFFFSNFNDVYGWYRRMKLEWIRNVKNHYCSLGFCVCLQYWRKGGSCFFVFSEAVSNFGNLFHSCFKGWKRIIWEYVSSGIIGGCHPKWSHFNL